MRRLLIIGITFLIGLNSYGQSTDIRDLFASSEDRGDKFFRQLEYEAAIDQYKIASLKTNKAELYLKLGRSYTKIRDFENAYHSYRAGINIFAVDELDSLDLLNFAESALALGETEEAVDYFQQYIDKTEDPRGQRRLEGAKIRNSFFANESFYGLKEMDLNTPYSELIGQKIGDGYLYSTNKDSQYGYYHVYTAHRLDTINHFAIEPIRVPPKYFNVSYPTFIEDSVVLFLATELKFGEKKPQMLLGDILPDGSWDNFRPFPVLEEFDNPIAVTPHMAEWGVLYFAADLPGGKGGLDIYITSYLDGEWSEPINLEEINTSGNDWYPYTYERDLYFTSDGYPGAGGYDIFLFDRIHDEIVNLGAPINSGYDDFGLALNNDHDGYFSSNRPGGTGGDDIYEYTTAELDLIGFNIEVRRKWNNSKIADASVVLTDAQNGATFRFNSDESGNIFGKVPMDRKYNITIRRDPLHPQEETITIGSRPFDGTFYMVREFKLRAFVFSEEDGSAVNEPIIFIRDMNTGEGEEIRANSSGYFELDKISGGRFSIIVSKEGYSFVNDTITFNAPEFNRTYELRKIKPTETITLDDLLYETNKHVLANTFLPRLDSIAGSLKKFPNTNILIIAHTDSKGPKDYNRDLSQRRAESVMEYLKSQGVDPRQLKAVGRGESEPLNDCVDGVPCTSEQHQINRRTDIQIFKGN